MSDVGGSQANDTSFNTSCLTWMVGRRLKHRRIRRGRRWSRRVSARGVPPCWSATSTTTCGDDSSSCPGNDEEEEEEEGGHMASRTQAVSHPRSSLQVSEALLLSVYECGGSDGRTTRWQVGGGIEGNARGGGGGAGCRQQRRQEAARSAVLMNVWRIWLWVPPVGGLSCRGKVLS